MACRHNGNGDGHCIDTDVVLVEIADIIGLIVLGFITGSLAATLGIGGGIIFVPVLVFVFGFGQLEAQGTSLAIILPTAFVAAFIHNRAGRVVWKVVLVTAGVGVLAAVAGANLAIRMDEAILRKAFAIVLALLAIRMARRAVALRNASAPLDGS